jgi:hypothetical protein
VELLDPPKTGPVAGDVVRRRGADPVVALSAFHADVLPAEEAKTAGGAEDGTGGGPAGIPPLEDMGGEQVLAWEAEREQWRVHARNQGHDGELDVSLKIREKPPTPLEHTGDRVPWHPSYPLPQRGVVYVRNFLTEVDMSRREGLGPDHVRHATGAGILLKRSNRRQGLWSDLHKQQRQGFSCHLGREWVATYRNLPNKETGEPRFTEDERTYRLKAMQHLVADLGAHYARLPNQPNLQETWAFHERLVLPPSKRGRSKVTPEFTVIYPNPDMEVEGPGFGGEPANEDLGPWQSHMAWKYGTDWVAGFLAGKRRYVAGPRPAPVGLWPIVPLRHPESDESGGKEDDSRRTTEAVRTQGVTTPSGPLMAPPSTAPPVVPTARPTIPERTTATPSTVPTPTVAPTPVATAPFTVPTTQPAAGRVSTTTTTRAQLPRERPPTTEERHPKRAATEAAATLQTLQRAAGGGPRGPAATAAAEGSQADQQWEQARAEVQRPWALGQQLQGEAQTKTTYTRFRVVAKMAQDALEAADVASPRARQERMASVGALLLTRLQLPGHPQMIEPSERLEAVCQDQVQALAQEILRRGAAAMAAGAASAGQGAQRPGGETGARASRGATQPHTMPPPPTPTRTTGTPMTTTGPQVSGGPPGPTLPTTAMRPEDRQA